MASFTDVWKQTLLDVTLQLVEADQLLWERENSMMVTQFYISSCDALFIEDHVILEANHTGKKKIAIVIPQEEANIE